MYRYFDLDLLEDRKKANAIFSTRQQALQYCKQQYRGDNPEIHIRRLENNRWAVNG